MNRLLLLLLVLEAALIVVGAVVPGLFSLALVGLALFLGTATVGLALNTPGPRPHH